MSGETYFPYLRPSLLIPPTLLSYLLHAQCFPHYVYPHPTMSLIPSSDQAVHVHDPYWYAGYNLTTYQSEHQHHRLSAQVSRLQWLIQGFNSTPSASLPDSPWAAPCTRPAVPRVVRMYEHIGGQSHRIVSHHITTKHTHTHTRATNGLPSIIASPTHTHTHLLRGQP